jgi:hypothetical protein
MLFFPQEYTLQLMSQTHYQLRNFSKLNVIFSPHQPSPEAKLASSATSLVHSAPPDQSPAQSPATGQNLPHTPGPHPATPVPPPRLNITIVSRRSSYKFSPHYCADINRKLHSGRHSLSLPRRPSRRWPRLGKLASPRHRLVHRTRVSAGYHTSTRTLSPHYRPDINRKLHVRKSRALPVHSLFSEGGQVGGPNNNEASTPASSSPPPRPLPPSSLPSPRRHPCATSPLHHSNRLCIPSLAFQFP